MTSGWPAVAAALSAAVVLESLVWLFTWGVTLAGAALVAAGSQWAVRFMRTAADATENAQLLPLLHEPGAPRLFVAFTRIGFMVAEVRDRLLPDALLRSADRVRAWVLSKAFRRLDRDAALLGGTVVWALKWRDWLVAGPRFAASHGEAAQTLRAFGCAPVFPTHVQAVPAVSSEWVAAFAGARNRVTPQVN